MLPSAAEYLFSPIPNEEREESNADEATATAGLLVEVPRSSQRRTDSGRAPYQLALSFPHPHMLIWALPVGTFAKRDGVGAPMRC